MAGGRKAGESVGEKREVRCKREFSKKIVALTMAGFWLEVAGITAAIYIKPEVAPSLGGVLATTAAFAGAVHVAYFGKAGMENYQKIARALPVG